MTDQQKLFDSAEDSGDLSPSQAVSPVVIPDGFSMGIDASLTSTGLIVLNKYGAVEHVQGVTTDPTDKDVFNRVQRVKLITGKVLEVVKRFRPKAICIENYSYGSTNVAPIIEMGFLIRYVITELEIPLFEVAPATLKKWASGSGKNAKTGEGKSDSKTRVIVSLVRRYDLSFENNDNYDAYALARMAYQIAGFETSEMAYQREAVQTVLNPKKKPKSRKPRGKIVE